MLHNNATLVSLSSAVKVCRGAMIAAICTQGHRKREKDILLIRLVLLVVVLLCKMAQVALIQQTHAAGPCISPRHNDPPFPGQFSCGSPYPRGLGGSPEARRGGFNLLLSQGEGYPSETTPYAACESGVYAATLAGTPPPMLGCTCAHVRNSERL